MSNRKLNKSKCQVTSYSKNRLRFYYNGFGLSVDYDGEVKSNEIELSHHGTSKNFKTFKIIDWKFI